MNLRQVLPVTEVAQRATLEARGDRQRHMYVRCERTTLCSYSPSASASFANASRQ